MKYIKNSFVVIPNKEFLKGKPAQMQAIYFWLCDHADDEGICFPSRTLIASEAGTTERSVDRYIKALVEAEILVKTTRKRVGTNQNLSNIYQIMILGEVVSKKTPGGVEKDTRGGVEIDTVTIPNITKPTELPEWMKREVWEKWESYRKEIKKKLTPLMIKQQIIFLEKHKEVHDQIIEKSIQNGWTGLFPLTGGFAQSRPSNVLTGSHTKTLSDMMAKKAAKNS